MSVLLFCFSVHTIANIDVYADNQSTYYSTLTQNVQMQWQMCKGSVSDVSYTQLCYQMLKRQYSFASIIFHTNSEHADNMVIYQSLSLFDKVLQYVGWVKGTKGILFS